ncbi:MAG TPA: Ig domain-containing protein [Gaiellaceae bacterium]
MRITRILLLVVAAAAVAAVIVPSASALAFPDTPCPVDPGGTVKICPSGETGKPYSLQLFGRDGTGCVPYVSWSTVGALPPGLSMSNGLISGTPTQTGTWVFWVAMKDIPASQGGIFWCSDANSTERQFSITITQGLTIAQRQSSLGVIAVNAPYSLQLTANGGGTLTWSVTSGALPTGINLNASSGLLSGTPTAKGDFSFQIQVTDGNRKDAQTYALSVVDPLKLSVSPVPGAVVGVPFELKPTISGGKPGYTFSITGGTLPEGLNLDAATGTISGKPTTPGTYPVKLTAKDTVGLTQTVDVKLVVATKLLFAKQPLKPAKVGKRYTARLVATGGARPFKWVLLGGRPGILPPGIKLNARTGVLSGTPTKAGLYRLRFQVTDKSGFKSSAGLVLKVTA